MTTGLDAYLRVGACRRAGIAMAPPVLLQLLMVLIALAPTAYTQVVTINEPPEDVPLGSRVVIECSLEATDCDAVTVTQKWSYRESNSAQWQILAENNRAKPFNSIRLDVFGRNRFNVNMTRNGNKCTHYFIADRVQESHSGRYNCSYTWSATSTTIFRYYDLKLLPAYRLVTREGSPLTAECDAVADVMSNPKSGVISKVNWFRHNASAEWTPSSWSSNTIQESFLNDSDPSTLVVRAATFNDSGLYYCNFTFSKDENKTQTSDMYTVYTRTINVTVRVPAGSVENIVLVNVSSTSLQVTWNASDQFGKEVPTFFNVSYRKKVTDQLFETFYRTEIAAYAATGLSPYVDYVFWVRGCNDIGCGPESVSDTFRTSEAAPAKPVIPNDQHRPGTNYIVFTWREPLEERGPITAYNVSWHERGSTSPYHSKIVEAAAHRGTPYSVNASLLDPEKEYEFIVRAINKAGQGDAASHTLTTDIAAPAAPVLNNVTFSSDGSVLTLVFTQPMCPRWPKCVDIYKIRYALVNSTSWNATDSHVIESPLAINLTGLLRPGEMYVVAMAGVRAALSVSNMQNVGAYSNPITVAFGSKEDDKRNIGDGSTDSPDKSDGGPAVIIVSIVVPLVVCAAVAATVIVIFLRRRKQHKVLDNEIQENFWIEINQPLLGDQHQPFEENEYDCILTSNWSSHVADLHADSDMKFTHAFEAVCRQSNVVDLKCLQSQEQANRCKNRYNNVLAYDHTRVLLKTIPGEICSDYINANYVDSYDKVRQFIATQGPLPNTIEDFWRMVWEQNSAVIVMITNVYEKGRKKCEQYWPSEGEATYGGILVRFLKEDVEELAFWTHRRFLIQNTMPKKKQQTCRYVSQFHYTDWPDHGTPEYSLPVLSYVRKACSSNPASAGPIIVHCSAGVGRSGTFILLHSMMKHIDLKRSVNVQGFLRHMRTQRNFLVQTEDQYVFVHDALLDYIQSGGRTEMKPYELPGVLEQLSNLDSDGLTNLEKQYKYVVKWRPREYLLQSSKKDVNRSKNRSPMLVPIDNSSRVKLPTVPGIDGSDYINASYFHGYFQSQEYIITQHPLASTEMDFWRMVWDQNSWTIVLLSNVGEEDMLPFWRPKNEATDGGGGLNFHVTFTEENLEAMDYVTRDFLLESKQDDYEMKARMFSITHWPETFTVDKVFEFVEVVNTWHGASRNQAGPVVVIDKYGGKMAATFCALSTFYNQFHQNKLVDVYSLAYVYHQKRPGVWETEADYHYLYKAVAALCEKAEPEDEEKAPVNGSTLHGGTTLPQMPLSYAFVRRLPSLHRSPGGQERVNSQRHSSH